MKQILLLAIITITVFSCSQRTFKIESFKGTRTITESYSGEEAKGFCDWEMTIDINKPNPTCRITIGSDTLPSQVKFGGSIYGFSKVDNDSSEKKDMILHIRDDETDELFDIIIPANRTNRNVFIIEFIGDGYTYLIP